MLGILVQWCKKYHSLWYLLKAPSGDLKTESHKFNSVVVLCSFLVYSDYVLYRSGSLTRAVMCPRARPLKSANGLRINVTCFTPASYGNPVVWLHNNLPVPNKPWWIVSSPSLAGPRNTLAHHLKLSAGLSDDSGNITCQVLGSGDGAQPHLSASVDIAIGGKEICSIMCFIALFIKRTVEYRSMPRHTCHYSPNCPFPGQPSDSTRLAFLHGLFVKCTTG